MTRYLAAFDGGGSSTQCVVLGAAGQIVGRGQGRGVTQIAEPGGVERCRRAVTEALAGAMGSTGLKTKDIDLAYLGMSGASPQMEAVIREALSGVSEIVIVHDSETALAGCLEGQPGIVVIAGTGSVALGKTEEGGVAYAGGWGFQMGDEGSGYWIGCRALSIATRAADTVIADSLLKDYVPRHFECTDLKEVHRKIHSGFIDRSGIATLTRVVIQAAGKGDRVSQELLAEAGSYLGRLVVSVAKKLKLVDPVYTYTGGVFETGPWILTTFTQEVIKELPQARFKKPIFDCLDGAVFLALKHAGISSNVYLKQRVS